MLEDTSPLKRFEDIARADGWTSLFPALEVLCQACVGHRLFSCSAFHLSSAEDGVAARVYTSDPVNYPVSGVKNIVTNRWTKQVILGREPFVANSVDGFSDVFPDHQLIATLGLGSVVNLPVILRGKFIGTINMLHKTGYYTKPRLQDLSKLVLPALLTFEVSPEAAH